MYYKDVEEEVAYKHTPSPGYNFGSVDDAMNWFKTPLGIAITVAIVAVIAFLVWWFLIREQPATQGSGGFKYY